MIVINFKNYLHAKKALDLAKKIAACSLRKNTNKKNTTKKNTIKKDKIIVAPATTDLSLISNSCQKSNLDIYAQHTCLTKKNAKKSNHLTTGHNTAFAIKAAGAKGTILNHSEHQLTFDQIKKTLLECKKNNLKTILCVKNLAQAKKFKDLNATFMAFEDPKLISGKVSIVNKKTPQLKKFLEILKSTKKSTKTKALCGAGINSAKDYHHALALGYHGVLISSAILKSKKPAQLLNSFLKK